MRFYSTSMLLKAIVCAIIINASMTMNAFADWRNDVGIFRIGIVSEGQTASYLSKLEPFRLALIEAMQIEVELYSAPDATALITALKTDRIEYAILPSTAYALAWVSCECVEPIVVPKASDSTDGYNLVLLSGPTGPSSLEELKTAQIGILSNPTIVGLALPLKLLADKGIAINAEEQIVSYDQSSDAIEDFTSGKIDALIGWSSLTGEPVSGYSRGTLTSIASKNLGDISIYKKLWQSPNIPHRPHVIRRKINGEAKRILRDTLLNLYSDNPVAYDAVEPIFGGGFTSTRQDRFRTLIEYMDGLYKIPDTEVKSEIEEETEIESQS